MTATKKVPLLRWLTPKYWVKRHHGPLLAEEASKLLPRPFDPALTAYELRHIDDFEEQDGSGSRPGHEGNARFDGFDEIVGRALEGRRSSILAAGAVGAATSVDFLQGFAAVDGRVLNAASDLFNERIESIGDLAQHLEPLVATAGLALKDAEREACKLGLTT